MSPKFLAEAYWRDRADEVLAKAEEMHGREARAALLQLARSYRRLAERANSLAEHDRRYAAEIAALRHRPRGRTRGQP
jgi:hypothetical protein